MSLPKTNMTTNLSIGIVGLPNVGKSTLFNAILKKQLAYVANYPFATIEPNVGVVEVPDSRVDKLADLSKSLKKVYSTITFCDIAGLVKGASTGAGLGNKFLSHIREVDLILMVLRDFEDENIVREGSVDPESDMETLLTELTLKDAETLSKKGDKGGKLGKIGGIEEIVEKKAMEILNSGGLLSKSVWSKEELDILSEYSLLTLKPMLILRNVSESGLRELEIRNYPSLTESRRGLEKLEIETLAVSAKIEFELAELSPKDRLEYLNDLGLSEPPLDGVIRKCFEMLGLNTFLTTGEKESRAWKFKNGWNAQKCAGVIHSDFERLFIACDVVPFEKLVEAGSWVKAKEKGWVRLEGKDYLVKDGDIVEFRVGRG